MFDESSLNSIQTKAGLNLGGVFSWPGFMNKILPYIFGIAGIILILNIISSGFKMMTSKGDSKALGLAQAKITTSAIGILILFASFWIVQLIMQFLGINLDQGMTGGAQRFK